MTPQEINIEIAKACGWKHRETGVDRKSTWTAPDGEDWMPLPNYHGDLNAMHEAENWLLKGPLTDMLGMNYWNNLWLVAKDDFKTLRTIGNATAAQRAEAFLRTLNLWKD